MPDTTLARAHALIAAAEKAKGLGTHIGIRAPDEAMPFLHAAISGSTDIARALVEAVDLLRRWNALDGGAWHVDRHASNKAELMDAARDWLAQHDGERK